MVEETFDNPDKRSERKAVALRKHWWRYSIFGARAMVARTKHDSSKLRWIMDGFPCRQSDFDQIASWAMDALQAGRQGRRIICDNQVASAETGTKRGAWQVAYKAVPINDEEF